MSITQRIKAAIGMLFDRYEGATYGGKERSWIPQTVQDARQDADSFTRQEIARKMRYFASNSWLVQKISEVFTKYTIGPNGLQISPASSDDEWNDRMRDSYLEWCEDPTRDSSLTMTTFHKLMARDYDLHGENFILPTYRKVFGERSHPAIQLIEGHRVSSPGNEWGSSANQMIVDGVQVDEFGKPIGYWIRDGFKGEKWSFRDAASVIHTFDPQRPGMYRDISPYYAVLNSLHDLDDLEMFEMQRAKINSQDANVWTTWGGEFSQDNQRKERYGTALPGNVIDPAEQTRRLEQYRQVLGSRSIAIRPGEKMEQHPGVNPSAATQWFWRYKISQIAAARGIPMLEILPESIQGTVARGIYDSANQMFRSKFTLFAHAAKRIYHHYAQWARYNIPDLADAPADWKLCHIIPPRAVNVDVGRNSSAQIAELAAGITTYEDIAGANGTTSDVQFYKQATCIGRIKQIAAEISAEMGVTIEPGEIAGGLADVLGKLAAADAASAQGEMARAQEELQTA